jgi:hypothetical protein
MSRLGGVRVMLCSRGGERDRPRPDDRVGERDLSMVEGLRSCDGYLERMRGLGLLVRATDGGAEAIE